MKEVPLSEKIWYSAFVEDEGEGIVPMDFIPLKDVKDYIAKLKEFNLAMVNPQNSHDDRYNDGMQDAIRLFKEEIDKIFGKELSK